MTPRMPIVTPATSGETSGSPTYSVRPNLGKTAQIAEGDGEADRAADARHEERLEEELPRG